MEFNNEVRPEQNDKPLEFNNELGPLQNESLIEDSKSYESPDITKRLLESSDLDEAMSLSSGDLEFALKTTRGVKPEIARYIKNISSKTNAPKDTVQRNLSTFEDIAKAKDITKMLSETNEDGSYKYPKTLGWLQNPEKMRLAKDDVNTLMDIEKSIDDGQAGIIEQAYKSLTSGLATFNKNLAASPALLYNLAAYPQNKIAKSLGYEEIKPPEFLTSNPIIDHYEKAEEELRPSIMNESILQQIKDGDISGASRNVFLAAVSNAPTLALMYFTGGTGAVSQGTTLAGMGALEASGSNLEQLERGKSPSSVAEAATIRGAAEGFFERYTLGSLQSIGKGITKTYGKETTKELFKGVATHLLKNFNEEGTSEALTSATQDFADFITGDKEALDGSFERAFNAYAVGGFTGFAMGGAHVVSDRVYHKQRLDAEIESLDKMEAVLATSKINQQDPELIEEFIDQAIADTNQSDKLYIPSQAVQTLFQSDPKGLEEFAEKLEINEQLEEAKDTGVDIEIPKSKWLAHYANSEISNALKNDMRFTVDGITFNEEQSLKDEVSRSINELNDEYQKLLIEEEAMPDQIKAIRKKMMDEQGINAEEADHRANIFHAMVRQLAKKSDMTTDQFLKDNNIGVEIGGEFRGDLFQDYRDSHTAPSPEGLNTGTDVSEALPDIYSISVEQALQYYGYYGQEMDTTAIVKIKEMASSPDEDVVVYRAVPRGEKISKINQGDWVAMSRGYAEMHGESRFDGEYDILAIMAKPSELATAGDIQEWGYNGQDSEAEIINLSDVRVDEHGTIKLGEAEANVDQRYDDMLEDLAEGLSDHVGGEALEINTLEVPLSSQGNGIGSELIDMIERYAASQGIEHIVLKAEPLSSEKVGQADPANLEKLKSFYERNGFEVFKEGETNYIMVKEVDPYINDTTLYQVNPVKNEVKEDNIPDELEVTTYKERYNYKIQAHEPDGKQALIDRFNHFYKDIYGQQIIHNELSGENFTITKENLRSGVDQIFKQLDNKKGSDRLFEMRMRAMRNIPGIMKKATHYFTDSVTGDRTFYAVANFDNNDNVVKIISDRDGSIKHVDVARIGKMKRGPSEASVPSNADEALGNDHLSRISISEVESRINELRRRTRFQGDSKPRGAISFSDTDTIIRLFEGADKSTFYHEAAHLYMHFMGKMIDQNIANEEAVKDWNTILDFTQKEAKKKGLEGHKDGKLTVEGEEIMARGFEAYLREGKAPSVKLQEAFSRLRDWLLNIYKSVAGLDVQLDDDIRGVFDRVLASEQEIAEVQLYYNTRDSFLKLLNPSKEESEKLRSKKKKAKRSAIEIQVSKKMKAYLKAIGGKKVLTEKVKDSLFEQDNYAILNEMKENGGINKEDFVNNYGEEAAENLEKLHGKSIFAKPKKEDSKKKTEKKPTFRNAVRSNGGIKSSSLTKDQKRVLREHGALSIMRKDGLALDKMAMAMIEDKTLFVPENRNSDDYLFEMIVHNNKMNLEEVTGDEFDIDEMSISSLAYEYDIKSPEALVEILEGTNPIKKELKTRVEEALIEEERKIIEEMVDQESFAGEESFHNPEQIAYLLAEAELLAQAIEKQTKKRQTKIDLKVVKDLAKEEIKNKPISRAGRYDLYAKSEQRWANKAYQLLEKGNIEKALEAKKKQIYNHALVQEAIKARDLKKKLDKNFRATNLKKLLNNTENSYAEKVKQLIQAYIPKSNFAPQKPDEVQSLEELDAGIAAMTPGWIKELTFPKGVKELKELPLKDYLELYETVKGIAHYGKDLMKSMKNEEYQSLEHFVDASVARMENLKDNKIYDEFDKKGYFINKVKGLLAKTQMVEFIFERLDNWSYTKTNEFGPLRHLFNRGIYAEEQFGESKSKVIEQGTKLFGELHNFKERIEKQYKGKAFRLDFLPVTDAMRGEGRNRWTAERLISMVLNMGNEGNMTALKNAYGFTDAQLNQVVSLFTKKELQAIQGIWDLTNSVFPDLDAVHFNLYNRHLDKVEPQKLVARTIDGEAIELKGGYYPLKFDHALNDRAEELAEQKSKKDDDIMNNRQNMVFRKSKPEDGMTYSRVPGTTLPPELSLNVWFEHMTDSLRYISHAEYMRDLNRVTLHKKIRTAIRKKAGRQIYNEIRDWTTFQALPERKIADSIWGRAIEKQRTLATVAILGANIPVGIKQRLSLFSAGRKVGWGYLLQGFKQLGVSGSLLGMERNERIQKIFEMSPYLRARSGNIDREIHDTLSKINPMVRNFKIGQTEFTWKDVQDFMFEWIQMNDRATVGAVWLGAYQKHMDLGKSKMIPEDKIHEQAVIKADEAVRTTQPSSLPLDLNSLQRSEGSMRLFTSFMTWTFKYGNIVQTANQAWKDGAISNREYFRHVMYDTVMPGWGMAIVSSLFVAGDLPEWWEMMTSPLENAISWIPFLRDVPGAIKYRRRVGESTAFEGMNRAVKASTSVWQSAKGKKDWDDTMWDLGRVLEFAAGVPALKFVKDQKRTYNNIKKIKEKGINRSPGGR